MNRRTFFAGLFTLPTVIRETALRIHSDDHDYFYQRTNGMKDMLDKCGAVVEREPLDLDSIFDRIYAIKRKRAENEHCEKTIDLMLHDMSPQDMAGIRETLRRYYKLNYSAT